MAIAAESAQVAWWREPTREQWHAWIAAWLGWTLDAFDFTAFLLIIAPIAPPLQAAPQSSHIGGPAGCRESGGEPTKLAEYGVAAC